MTVTEDLPVSYHQQDTDYYCGAACAQMVLDSIGAGLLSQDDLYNDTYTHSTIEPNSWYSEPDGLLWTMNNRKPPSPIFNSCFVLDVLNDEDSISRAIIWTIHHYRVAPIALVYGGNHWIVVRGYSASAAPNGFADGSYTINSFDVNNPWPQTPAPGPPPPHDANDGCGGGGNRGLVDENISYATWQSDYMTGVKFGHHWKGKFVAVCDPDPPRLRPGVSSQQLMKPLAGVRLIDTPVAHSRALESLKIYDLHSRPNYQRALSSSQPGEPLLVARLDRVDSFYSLVPFRRPRGDIALVVALDARTGVYKQAAVARSDSSHVVSVLDKAGAASRVVGHYHQLEGRLGRLLARPEAVCHSPTLVWKPCRESLSPFYPFHLFTVAGHSIYVRIDGAVFTQLHDTDGGI